MAGLGSVRMARGPGHGLMRRRYSMPEIIMRKYNLAQQKLDDSSGCESGIRAGMSSQEPSCSEGETNALRDIDQCIACNDENNQNTSTAGLMVATAGNEICLLEENTNIPETAATTIANASTSTTTAPSTSITSPLSVTTVLHTQSTESITTADSAVADMAATDNNSTHASSELAKNTSNVFLSAEYLQRIVDKQMEELYSDTTSKHNGESARCTVISTPQYETDEDIGLPVYHDIGSIATGSSYQQYLAEHLCVPRYSAMPRTASMEVHPSSCNISESEGESLVDSLDDPMSPRPSLRHDNRLVRGCVMELLPDNNVQEHKVDRGEAFFIPIKEDKCKVEQNVAEMLPEKLRERLARREKKRILRKEHALRKKQKRMQRNYEQQQFRDKERYAGSPRDEQVEVSKPKVQIKPPPPLTVKRKRSSTSRDEILKLESYRIDGRGEMQIDPPRRKNEFSKKRVFKAKREQPNNTSKELVVLNSNENLNQLQTASSSEALEDTGPRRVYQKTEIQDGEKTIEILEIVECIESSPEVVPICMYRTHYKNNSKIPVPVYRSGSNVYTKQRSKENSSNANSNIDKLIAKILIDALNNKNDEVHFVNSTKSPKDRKSTDVISNIKSSSHVSFRRSTLPQIRRSANQKFLQKFEVIPEERGSISFESSAEETPACNTMDSPVNCIIKDQKIKEKNQINLLTENQNLKSPPHELKNKKKIEEENRKLIGILKKYQDQSTQIYDENEIDVRPNLIQNVKNVHDDMNMNQNNINSKIANDVDSLHNEDKQPHQPGVKVAAETQTDNNNYDDLAQDSDNNIKIKKTAFLNDKYVQTINLQSSSSQTSPIILPNVVTQSAEQNDTIRSDNLNTSKELQNKLDHKLKPGKIAKQTSEQSSESKHEQKPKQTTEQKTDYKPEPDTSCSAKSNLLKGKKNISNSSLVSTINTTITESSRSKIKDKVKPKIRIKKTSVIKSSACKENITESDKKNGNIKRSSIRRVRNPNTVNQDNSDEQTVSFKTKTKHINEVRTRLKPDVICDCMRCCVSSDDGDCCRSQGTASCSYCARPARKSPVECTFCDGEGYHRHEHTPFNETMSYHKTVSVMSISTPDIHQQCKSHKMRASPSTPVLLTPTDSEISETNHAEWLNAVNGNAKEPADYETKHSPKTDEAVIDFNPLQSNTMKKSHFGKNNVQCGNRDVKLTRRKVVHKCPTIDAETVTQHEIKYNKNRQLQLVRPQSAGLSASPGNSSSRRIRLPDPFSQGDRAHRIISPDVTGDRRKKDKQANNNPGMWSVTLAGNYCPDMPPDVEMRLRFPKQSRGDESSTEAGDNGSRPCTRCGDDTPTGNSVRRHTAAPNDNAHIVHSDLPTRNTHFNHEHRSSNILPGVNRKGAKDNKSFKSRKIIKRFECITAVSSTPRDSSLGRARNYTSDVHNISHYLNHEPCHHMLTNHCGPLSRRASLSSFQPCLSVMGSAIAPEQKPRVPTMSERDLTRAQAAHFSRTRSYLD